MKHRRPRPLPNPTPPITRSPEEFGAESEALTFCAVGFPSGPELLYGRKEIRIATRLRPTSANASSPQALAPKGNSVSRWNVLNIALQISQMPDLVITLREPVWRAAHGSVTPSIETVWPPGSHSLSVWVQRLVSSNPCQSQYPNARLFGISLRHPIRTMIPKWFLLVVAVLALAWAPLFFSHGDRGGRAAAARAQITFFLKALRAYAVDTGRYPLTAEGLAALRTRPASVETWRGPYLQDVPRDPWDRAYVYVFPGRHGSGPDIFSYGADGKTGGSGLNADVESWSLARTSR
jgi:general secretion pathway protein G